MSKSVVVFLADGCEPLEVVAPTDVLRRGGVEVVLASIKDDLAIRAAHAKESSALDAAVDTGMQRRLVP